MSVANNIFSSFQFTGGTYCRGVSRGKHMLLPAGGEHKIFQNLIG